MQDRFEKFVHEHRDEFDKFEPREQLWTDVQDKLRQRRTLKNWRSLSIAAAVLLLVTCGIWITQSLQKDHAGTAAGHTGLPAIQQAEYYYASQVMTRYSELDKYRNEYPQLCNTFISDLESLGRSYGQLKQEYDRSGNEAVLRAMIENLQMQVQLLGQQLQIIQHVEQKESKTISI